MLFRSTGANVLAALIQSASGVEIFTGTAGQTLPAMIQSATGLMQPSGTAGQILAALIQSGAGVGEFTRSEERRGGIGGKYRGWAC